MHAQQLAAPATDPALDIHGLGYGEHLLVWSWRRVVAGRIGCPVMAKEFADACGEEGPKAFFSFCSFLAALSDAARKPLAVGFPGMCAITPDERRVLTLIAALQAGMPDLAEAHLRWLARPEQRPALHKATAAVAGVLGEAGLHLGLPGA